MVQGRDVDAGLGGRWVALRPLLTWNGEGASGVGMRQGQRESPQTRPWEIGAGPWRQ